MTLCKIASDEMKSPVGLHISDTIVYGMLYWTSSGGFFFFLVRIPPAVYFLFFNCIIEN